eukprot:TRINITY_DN91400_c0_g1_i1.p3 TRINITY_DN91400_c0_g1~~TRINITY_DN91400_c0_g1_i1.p3  ORF type:complete len:106 (-),score=22.01 TRINITY_DN91400_c0_g1_i1:95-412(-)
MTTIPAKIAKAQEDANKYIEVHTVDKVVTKMMNAVIKERPEDPRVFMINWLAKECTDAELEESGLERPRKFVPMMATKEGKKGREKSPGKKNRKNASPSPEPRKG